MKVKIISIRHIKDFIRSLPPNVESQSFGMTKAETR